MIDINYIKERVTIDKNWCWNWNLYKTKSWYWRCSLNLWEGKKSYFTHRLAYMIHNQVSIVKWIFLLHQCDNPACCNPDHLFVWTHEDNMDDMKKKGRVRNHISYWNKYAVKYTIIIDWMEFAGFEEAWRHLGITGNWVKKRVKSGKYDYEVT